MLRWHRRPDPPPDFEIRVASAQRQVEVSIQQGQQPDFEASPHWREYKSHYQGLQHGKCAYCEANVEAVSVGHIDHFRPKGSVSELHPNPEKWGDEVPGTCNVQGRSLVQVSTVGYHWLAYSWQNFCFSCERCNTGWKRDLFPVADAPRPSPPDPATIEQCLLLDPFGAEDPAQHLLFGPLGSVEAFKGSAKGRATIDTLGLDRTSLRNARQGHASDVHRLVAQLKKDAANVSALESLARLGGETRIHAGMVRAIVFHELGFEWSELLALVGEASARGL